MRFDYYCNQEIVEAILQTASIHSRTLITLQKKKKMEVKYVRPKKKKGKSNGTELSCITFFFVLKPILVFTLQQQQKKKNLSS